MENDSQDNAATRPRVIDHTNRDARLAVAGVASRCQPLRARLAVIEARAKRRLTSAERRAMIEECEAFQRSVEEARTDLVLGLMDAPERVRRHSRVSDVDKALDQLDALTTRLKASLAD